MKLNRIGLLIKSLDRRQKLVGGIVLAAFALLVAFALLMQGNRPPKVTYGHFVSNTGGFEAEVPDGKMEAAQASYKVSDHKLNRHTYTSTTGSVEYLVSHFDLPVGLITPPERTGLINTLIAEYLISFNGIVAKSEPVKQGGYEGLKVVAEGAGGEEPVVATVMVVTVSNRVYLVAIKGNPGELTRRKTDRFLESFGFVF
ncbi:MAG TPA: hypothetical protein P5228_01215 [Bacteroidales bacterium]|nr:hypothetical protein [Bacteroidales bacterium]HRZ49150.1 hypothetical protein [Bacteroidales bacterium]